VEVGTRATRGKVYLVIEEVPVTMTYRALDVKEQPWIRAAMRRMKESTGYLTVEVGTRATRGEAYFVIEEVPVTMTCRALDVKELP
jgi:uncharacterized protein YbaR (Trm112 family)